MRISHLSLALVLPLSLVWACGSSSGDASFDGTGAGATSSAGTFALGGDGVGLGGEASGVGQGGTGATGSANVGGSLVGGSAAGGATATGTTACSNGEDDDGDGLIDGFDPECTGAGDNDEGSYATGMPGDNRDGKWQDCFFDGNSGAGEDGCRYATGCLTGDLDIDSKDCALTQACLDYCAPLVPNGCHCFGCCTVQGANGDTLDVITVSTCSVDKLGDESACPRCVKSDACGNTCGRCELCPGKTVADLPADCVPDTGGSGGSSGTGGSTNTGGSSSTGGSGTGGGPAYTCDGGEQVCGPDLPACSLGHYCSFGCCLVQPPK